MTEQHTEADDMAGSKSRHPAYRNMSGQLLTVAQVNASALNAAWEALPDDLTVGDHETIADAIRALVADRDEWRRKAEAGREDIDAVWRELPNGMRAIGGVLFCHIRALVADRDEWQALAAVRLRAIEDAWAALRRHHTGPHETLADAIDALATYRGDGWRNALETVSDLMAEQADASAEFQNAYAVGLLSGLLAVDRG